MIDEGRQRWGIAGVLLAIPAVSIYAAFFLSRFFYGEMVSIGGAIIPDSELTQVILFLGLPIIGLLASMWAYGAAHDSLSKIGLVLNILVLLVTVWFLFSH